VQFVFHAFYLVVSQDVIRFIVYNGGALHILFSHSATHIKHAQVIRTATLQFGYLDHFKKPDKQLAPYILPVLCANWRAKGHATALGWASTQAGLKATIGEIEKEVGDLCLCCVCLLSAKRVWC